MKLEIDIEKKGAYDVIVVGSGPAGVSAAILAGRNGAKTLLIESCGRVGGISTSGMMSHFTGRCGNMLYHEILELGVDYITEFGPIAEITDFTQNPREWGKIAPHIQIYNEKQ